MSGDYRLAERTPTAREFLALRRDAGWLLPDATAAGNALRNSLFCACVEQDGRCVGSGRVVGDGHLVFHVQDVIVASGHRRCGCGSMIMDALMAYIHRTASPAAFVALFAAPAAVDWYKRYGFFERPHENLGPGMAFFEAG